MSNNYIPEAFLIGVGLVIAANLIKFEVTVNINDKPIITQPTKNVIVDSKIHE